MIDLTKETKERIIQRDGALNTLEDINAHIATPEAQVMLRAFAVELVGSEDALKELEESGATVEVDLEWGEEAK